MRVWLCLRACPRVLQSEEVLEVVADAKSRYVTAKHLLSGGEMGGIHNFSLATLRV